MAFVKSIRVIDGNGDEVTVYEFHDRRFLRKIRRMTLDTGEPVERVCERTYIVSATGERLTRVSSGRSPGEWRDLQRLSRS